jgi:hypothetical protein
MPYVQFTERHYLNDRLYEAGDRAWLADDVGLSPGMIDLGAEAKAAAPTSAEQKAAMDKVLAERKAADEAAANEIAMEMAVERTKVEAKAAEEKAAAAAEKQPTQATNRPPGALPLNPAPAIQPGPTKEA